jgi:geranylgeranyl reductase family protein
VNPTPFDADAIVVGAGPAGATAARALAIGGARTLLLERGRFPRNKPCGGAISMRARARFPWLDEALGRIPVHQIARLHLEGPSGGHVVLESRDPAAIMIRRVEFDELLARLAVEAGATLVEETAIGQATARAGHVELRSRDGRVFRAPVVVAADGVNSVVARRLGLNRGWGRSDVALDMMEETPASTLAASDPSALWVAYGYRGSEGYAYVFPKRDHVNVGIGYVLAHYRERIGEAPYELQQAFVDVLRGRGVLAGRSCRAHFTPFLIPVAGPLPDTAHRRVLLTGDAGGFVNGFTAEGIYYAMVTGELAAEAILDGSPDAPHRIEASYERAWRGEIGVELRDSVLLQRYLFGDPRRIEAVIAGARAYPRLANAVIDYARGTLTYRQARRRVLLRFPLVALKVWAATHGRRRQL